MTSNFGAGSRLKRETKLEINPALIAGRGFWSKPTRNASGLQEVRRRDRSVRSVQILVVDQITRIDTKRQVVAMLRTFATARSATRTTAAKPAASTRTTTATTTAAAASVRASRGSFKFRRAEAPCPAYTQID